MCNKQAILLESWISRAGYRNAIEPKNSGHVDKLSIALNKLAEEDPTFQFRTDPTAGRLSSMYGELHLEISSTS